MIRLLSLAAFVLATAWAPPILAQTGQPPAMEAARDFTDSDLKTFAAALVQVARINDNYLPIYYAAKTPEEQLLIEQKAADEMVRAVRNEGMSVDQYHQILGQARVNPEIANRINEHVKDAVTK